MTPNPRKARLATSIFFFINGTGLGMWSAHIPVLKAELGLNAGDLGLALLAMALGGVVAMPLAGPLTARWGSRLCVVVSGVAYGLALGLPLLMPSYTALVGSALLLGAANGSMDVCMNTQASTVERAYAQPIMSSFHAYFSLGGITGAMLAGILLALGTAPTLNMAVAGILIAAITLRSHRFLLPATEEHGAGFALPTAAALGIGLLALLTLLAEGAVMDWSAVYLATVTGATTAVAALGYAAFSATMALGRLTGDAFVRRVGRGMALTISGLLGSAGLAIATLGGTVAGVIGFGITGIGLANACPILFSTGAALPGVAPGVGVAMVATLGYAGFLLGPATIGFVAEYSSLRTALLLIVPGLLILSLVGRKLVRAVLPAATTA